VLLILNRGMGEWEMKKFRLYLSRSSIPPFFFLSPFHSSVACAMRTR